MKTIVWILATITTLKYDAGFYSVSASSSYFKKIYGKDMSSHVSLKKKFFQCDRVSRCSNVVETKNGKYQMVNGVKELKNLKDIVSIWKKMKNIAVCEDVKAVGMQSKEIPNDRVTASSYWEKFGPAEGRLTFDKSWYSKVLDSQQFLQVDFGRRTLVHAVATQGRKGDKAYWVKTYLVSSSSDGKYFEAIWDSSTMAPKLFAGNTDYDGIVRNNFSIPLETRYIRIHPKSYVDWIAMRLELYGCYI